MYGVCKAYNTEVWYENLIHRSAVYVFFANLLTAEYGLRLTLKFVLHRQNLIFVTMAASLATLEDTGSVSDSSSVSESEIPYSTRILLMTVEKLKKAKPAGARPILPAPPRALDAGVELAAADHGGSRSIERRLCNNHWWVFYSIKIISIYISTC